MPGFHELLVILAIVIIVFGAGKLPQIGDSLGRGIRNFRKAMRGENEIDVTSQSQQIPQPPPRKDDPRA